MWYRKGIPFGHSPPNHPSTVSEVRHVVATVRLAKCRPLGGCSLARRCGGSPRWQQYAELFLHSADAKTAQVKTEGIFCVRTRDVFILFVPPKRMNLRKPSGNLLRLNSGSYAPYVQHENREIHTVFPRFPCFRLWHNLLLSALADFLRAS